jgi:LysR family glycine cleavage system transcriptional activator
MATTTHLRSLQALEMAVREGSLRAAADRLGITPAAVGQRIRALEEFLGMDLLTRGRSGLIPTPELARALPDLRAAFGALDRVAETLDFQRLSEIHIVAEPDLAELWLEPRLPAFRADHPNIRFCINGAGDVPLRLGAPDIRIVCEDGTGTELFRDVFLPVSGPDNTRRIAGWDPALPMEGMPLLHLKSQRDTAEVPGWVTWFARFGQRQKGPDRGVHYQHARVALEAVRQEVGFLVCGLSLLLADLANGRVVLPFPAEQNLPAPYPYRLRLRPEVAARPQVARFVAWLEGEAATTAGEITRITGRAPA